MVLDFKGYNWNTFILKGVIGKILTQDVWKGYKSKQLDKSLLWSVK